MADGKPGRPLKDPDAPPSKELSYYRRNKERLAAERRAKAEQDPNYWRDRRYRARYGITFAEAEAMLAGQDGRCAACRDPLELVSERKLAHVDHDHATGAVRGILCVWCNQALGSLKESTRRAEGLIRYMQTKCTNQYAIKPDRRRKAA